MDFNSILQLYFSCAYPASDDRTVKLWSLDGELLHTLKHKGKNFTHDLAVTSISFNSTGQLIATASDDQTVKLWSRDGKLLHTFRGHVDEVKNVTFSQNDRLIATGGADRIAYLWDINLVQATLDELLEHGCQLARDYLENNLNIDGKNRNLCDGIDTYIDP